jgi:dipeptidyl aminopeptidase/acylaminoacyl peptidase
MRRTVFLSIAAVAALALPLAAGAAKAPDVHAIVFASNRAQGDWELYIVNSDGTGLRRLTYNSLSERQAVWSPDRTQIAFSARDGNGNSAVYLIKADGTGQHAVTSGPADDFPQWTPDGRIVFQRGSRSWIVNADGSSAAELPTGPGTAVTPSVSAKGTLAFSSDRGGPTTAVFTMQLDGKGLRQITFPTAGMDDQPVFSPNGTDISFVRDNGTNDNDLYVVHLNGGGLTQLTATPSRGEFWSSWLGTDVVFSARDSSFNWHLYEVPSTGGLERQLSTSPAAGFSESFDNATLDSSLWHTIQDPGGSIVESNGQLLASITTSAVPGGQFNQIDEHAGWNCRLNGDYDYQADYSLVTWPQFGGFFANLNAFFGNASVSRSSSEFNPPFNQQYQSFMDGGAGSFSTNDTSGSFRLVRANGIVSAYVKSPTIPDWRLVASGSATGSTVLGMGLQEPGNQFTGQAASVAFDNFRLNSGAVTCPSWWQDFAPSVA